MYIIYILSVDIIFYVRIQYGFVHYCLLVCFTILWIYPAFLYVSNSTKLRKYVALHLLYIFLLINLILSKINHWQVKQMWSDIRECWNVLENERERDIMRKYSSMGELCTLLLTRMKIIKQKNNETTILVSDM